MTDILSAWEAAMGVLMPSTIRKGDDGDLVQYLQEKLNAMGWDLELDGEFGPETQAVVKQFQRDHDLAADGIVGPRTWEALEEGC
jgi:peptidoglycan hydrolase-like protein with peptidoglycan-binding domain